MGWLPGKRLTLVLWLAFLAAVGLTDAVTPPATAQPQVQAKPEELAAQLLNAANQAYNEKQFPVAADRYREYLKLYGNQPGANAARFGLALAVIELPAKDSFKTAIDNLNPVAGVQDFPERPAVLYYLGLAHRAQGHDELAQAFAKPAEAPQRKAAATQLFNVALPHFANSAAAFEVRVKAQPVAEKLTADQEWLHRARCDQAEMLLRLEKTKEAADLLTPLVATPAFAKSRYRPFGLYLHGHASFLLRDYLAAGKSLSQLAPFADQVFGNHTQYLLGRTHHVAEERPEATLLYTNVLTGFDKQKVLAQQALQNPATGPEEKQRLDLLLKSPPDYVSRASFYLGVLLYEQLKFTEMLARFTPFAQQYPQSPLIAEAQLRQGFCQVELKQYGEAMKTLQPLTQHPQLADRALLWSARAIVAAADPNQPPAYTQALATATGQLQQAAEKSNQQISQNPDAKVRRAEALMELGDVQQLAKQFPPAVASYETALRENFTPERTEEFLQRLATAQHFANQFDPADATCLKFEQTFPKSVLLPVVLFRAAENAAARAMSIEPTNLDSKHADRIKWLTEAVKRYQRVLEKYPEFTYTPKARFRLAVALYRLGNFDLAIKQLAGIAAADQQGELATVPYYHGDCLLRTLPAATDDALGAGRLVQQAAEGIKFLDSFAASQPQSPQAPDALLKLGYGHAVVASQIATPADRNKALAAARQTFEKLMQQFPNHPHFAVAVLERAKVMIEQGDVGGGMNELNRFKAAPLATSSVAPVAWLRIATLLRAQNKAVEAVALLAQCRQQYEAPLTADPARAAWVPLLQYHHGLAVKETGKLADARGLFEKLVQGFPNSQEAPEAAWRAGQCRMGEAQAKIDAIRTVLANPAAKPDEQNAARQQLPDAVKAMTETAQYFTAQAAGLAQKPNLKGSETHLRMFYEAAWCFQTLADLEIEATRQKLADEATKKLQEELAKKAVGPATPALQNVPQKRVEIPLAAVPVQPSEQAARDQYKAILATAPAAPLAIHAGLELAEMHGRRGEHDPAIQLLLAAIDREPSTELEDRLRVRLGVSLLAKNDANSAFEQFASVALVNRPLSPEARYRAGECQMQLKNFPKAIELWLPFRDQAPLQNVPGLSDRVLARLGHAYALASQWEPSRQTFEMLLGRYPQSTWRYEARYGLGYAWQKQGQYDNAANSYQIAINETATEVAAKSQYQLALCRIEQKRLPEAATALLVVPFTYDYPEWSALALLEASRVFVSMQQPQQAARLLERVQKDFPNSDWSKTAQQRLSELPVEKKG